MKAESHKGLLWCGFVPWCQISTCVLQITTVQVHCLVCLSVYRGLDRWSSQVHITTADLAPEHKATPREFSCLTVHSLCSNNMAAPACCRNSLMLLLYLQSMRTLRQRTSLACCAGSCRLHGPYGTLCGCQKHNTEPNSCLR